MMEQHLENRVMFLEHMLTNLAQSQHQQQPFPRPIGNLNNNNSNTSATINNSSSHSSTGGTMHDFAARHNYNVHGNNHGNQPSSTGGYEYIGGRGGQPPQQQSSYLPHQQYHASSAHADHLGGASFQRPHQPSPYPISSSMAMPESHSLHRRITELEASYAASLKQLRTEEEKNLSLEGQKEALQRELLNTQQKLNAAVANAKLAEAAASVATIEARKSLEESERSATVWNTIQTFRAAFARADLQEEHRKEQRKHEHPSASQKKLPISTENDSSKLSSNNKSVRNVKSEVKSEPDTSLSKNNIEDFVSAYNSGLSRSKKDGLNKTLDENNNQFEAGKKRARDLSATDDAEGDYLFNTRRGGRAVPDIVIPAEIPTSVARRYAENETLNPSTSTPLGKLKNGAKKNGRTPRTPNHTGAEKLANKIHTSVFDEEGGGSASTAYHGPKGVSQMSSAAMSSVGGGFGGGRTPPFSPMPKPIRKASGGNPSNGVFGNPFITNTTAKLAPPASAAAAPYHNNHRIDHDDAPSATFDVNNTSDKILSHSASASQNNRSHTNMSFVRRGGGNGAAENSSGNDFGTDNRYRGRNGVGGGMTRSPTPTNPTRGPNVERRFILSGLSEDDRKKIYAVVAALGSKAEVLDSGVDAPPPQSCTHVVIPGAPQSFKALCGLVSCRWLITPQYIFDSYAAGFWLNESESNHVRCHPPPLAHKKFLVTLPPISGGGTPSAEMLAMKEKLEFVIRYGDGIVVRDARGTGVVVIQSGDDIYNYCIRPQN